MASFPPLIATSQFPSSFQFRLPLILWDLPDRHHTSQCSRMCLNLRHNLYLICMPLLFSITSKAWTSESEMCSVPGLSQQRWLGSNTSRDEQVLSGPRWARAGEYQGMPLFYMHLSHPQDRARLKQSKCSQWEEQKVYLKLESCMIQFGRAHCAAVYSTLSPITSGPERNSLGSPSHNFACWGLWHRVESGKRIFCSIYNLYFPQ